MRSRIKDPRRGPELGFTLFELVITLTVLSILVMGTIPLAQNSVQRQKEIRLRESLRMMRNAIDEFKRDTLGACPRGSTTTTNPTNRVRQADVPTDPRSRVVIDDCTIFDTENIDRYPPSLEVLVEGVKVRDRGMNATAGSGITDGSTQATDLNEDEQVVKHYLREIPIDPMTGKTDWKFRSSYQDADDENWDNINVFDVRSASKDTGMNEVKYSEW